MPARFLDSSKTTTPPPPWLHASGLALPELWGCALHPSLHCLGWEGGIMLVLKSCSMRSGGAGVSFLYPKAAP